LRAWTPCLLPGLLPLSPVKHPACPEFFENWGLQHHLACPEFMENCCLQQRLACLEFLENCCLQ
jgi:hypothetical protein